MKNRIFTGNFFAISLLILPFLFLTTACEDFFISEATNVKIPGSESKLVVNSYISPHDSILVVYVKRSQPYTQSRQDHKPVADRANVFMGRKGGNMVKFVWAPHLEAFIMSPSILPIEEGVYYTLRVETHDGETVQAECYVPPIQVAEVTILEPIETTGRNGENLFTLEWRISIEGGNADRYFRTGAISKTIEQTTIDGIDYEFPPYFNELEMLRGNSMFMDRSGSSYSFRAQQWMPQNFIIDPDTGRRIYKTHGEGVIKSSFFVYIVQSDFNYYMFHKTSDAYYYHDDDFPFAEGVRIFSNIQGGLGVFGGYNRKIFNLE